MSPLRQEAIKLIESVPEENLLALIQKIKSENDEQLTYRERLAKKQNALEALLKHCKPIPDLDEKKELAQYREERFGNANLG